MDKKVLVTYSSKHGATAEIAERVGHVLDEAGFVTVVEPVDRVHDIRSFDAVVLGSAVYAGQWRKDAAEFLADNERRLMERPVWLFSSGPTGEGDPATLMKGWTFPEAQQPIADRIRPRDIALFSGEIDLEALNLPEKLIVKGVKAPIGDYRDWLTIETWAAAIAEALEK
jgi:menaquinone-dependent protoporphyrinogen oxidase